ncbi:MAG: hypothetical protein JXB03_13460 [Spirochaetales bacterium]|nr:hypothetical protein [Spirochaetales bacterium]
MKKNRSTLSCLSAAVFAAAALCALLPLSCTRAEAGQPSQETRDPDTPEALSVAFRPREGVSASSVEYFSPDDKENPFALYEGDEPLTVTSFGPEGELPVEMKRPDIFVSFNHPMVPLGKLGEPMTSLPYMKIEPKTEGLFRWYGSRLLSFEPKDPMEGQKLYTVTLRKDISSIGGKQLEEDFTFTFFNEYLKIVQMYPGYPGEGEYIDMEDVPMKDAAVITLVFNAPVQAGVVQSHISVVHGQDNLSFQTARPSAADYPDMEEMTLSRMLILTLDEKALSENRKVQIRLEPGARSAEGNIGRQDAQVMEYHTIKPFLFKEQSSYSWAFPRSSQGDSNPLFLEFSHPLNEESVKGRITTDLDVQDLDSLVEVWDSYIKINNLPVSYESTYTVYISPDIADIYGRRLGNNLSVPVEIGPATSYYYFPNRGTKFLEAAYAPKIIYEFQNVWEGDWKIAKIDNPYASFPPGELGPYSFEGIEKNIKHFEVLDLSPYLNEDGKGAVGIAWNFSPKNRRNRHYSQNNLQVQVTDLGITCRYGYDRVLVWVNALSTGNPVPGARVNLLNKTLQRNTAETDTDGLAVFELSPGEYRSSFVQGYKDHIRVEVIKDSDRAVFEPNGTHRHYRFGVYNTSQPSRIEEARAETFMFTDRGLYKPGETLTYRGIDRHWNTGAYSNYYGSFSLSIRPQGYNTKPVFTTSGFTTKAGGFWGTWQIGENLNPGNYLLEYSRGDHDTSISFQVANFRRAEFFVSLTPADRTWFMTDELSARGEASYLSGGGVSGGRYTASWHYTPTVYRPPGNEWKSYRFSPYAWDGTRSLERTEGILDGDGKTVMKAPSGKDVMPGIPYAYTAELAVQDPARQELSASASFMVHPAAFYIGSKFTSNEKGYWSTFVKAGVEQTGDLVLVTPGGMLLDEKAAVTGLLKKHSWQTARMRGIGGRISTRWERVEETVETFDLETKNGRTGFTVTPPESGEYSLEFSATDENGRTVISRINFYATGSRYVQWNQGNPEEIELICDKDEYKSGETARILVKSPIEKGRYLLTLEREGIFWEKIITLEGSASVIEIPVKEEHLPVVYAALSSYSPRTGVPGSYYEPDLGKPKGLFGLAKIHVSKEPVTFDVTITPSKQIYAPGEEGEVEITVTQNGVPVPNAEVTFLAVDRGVVDLINYHVPDPVEFFYADYKFPLGTAGADSRSLLMDPVTYEITDLQGGDDKLNKRKDFNPLAVFEPYLSTDARGKVVHRFTFPDTLTTYRTTAIVVEGQKFGRVETEMNVRNPITMRSSLPMALRYRDTAHAGVLLTNLSPSSQDVLVRCEAKGITIEGQTEKRLTLDANATTEVPFTLSAREAGTAVFVFTLVSDVLSEQLEAQLEIQKPLIAEAFTVAGSLDTQDNMQEALVLPQNITKGFGAVSLSLSGNPLSRLKDGITYMIDRDQAFYDARMSRALPFVLFGKELASLGFLENPGEVKRFLDSVPSYQLSSGGICPYPSGDIPSSYHSVKTAHFLTLAAARGHKVPPPVLRNLLTYLSGLYNNNMVSDYVKRYALYVLSLNGRDVSPQLDSFLKTEDENGITGYGFLGLSYEALGQKSKANDCLKRIKKFIKLGTRSIDLYETYEKRFYFDSELTAMSLLQELIYRLDSDKSLLAQVSNSIMDRQKHGYWNSISDTWWVLVSTAARLQDYLDNPVTTTATVSLAGTQIAEISTDSVYPLTKNFGLFDDPLASLPRNEVLPLTFLRQGSAPVYYSAVITYALPNEVLYPRDEGFSIYSRIENLEGQEIETLVPGQTYRMKVVVSSARDRSMVNLRVPVPSGCDILDASFVSTPGYYDEGGVNSRSWSRDMDWGTETEYVGEGYYDDGYISWIKPFMRIMKNEVRYEITHFYAGKQEYRFLFRAVYPGVYPTPGAFAQCLYEEEVFGRSAGWLGIIED